MEEREKGGEGKGREGMEGRGTLSEASGGTDAPVPHLVCGINFPYTLSTSFQSLCLCPACSCFYHIFSLCQITTLTIHNSLSLFHSRSRPTSFTNLSHHRLPSSLRTDSTDFTTGPFLLSISFLRPPYVI